MLRDRLSTLHLINHPKRTALKRKNLNYFLWRYLANGGRATRALLVAKTFPDARAAASELRERGIAHGPSEAFLSPEGREALTEVSREILAKSESAEVRAIVQSGGNDGQGAGKKKDAFLVELIAPEDAHAADDALVRLALDRKLLEIVASYLGLWPELHAIYGWLNFPTPDAAQHSQLWHRDPEDMRLVKVFIYLVDVDEKKGPFSYIPGSQPFGDKASLVPRSEKKSRVLDGEMEAALPPETWQVCTGPANTLIMADTVGYHRGGKPSSGERILVTFTYTSGVPMTARRLIIRGAPTWPMTAMQRAALSSATLSHGTG